ncbi:ABC transporter permease [Hyperthermus butylicus]|uniref:ABC transporter n=1 Tax=Hyperthermus butylicus (strain DSM 5456 / JCM 9403 / PLM1-5) TaxID=415426 RepID=A2BMM9_HYPBU|nr:ABC transporter permease [Hyperthermus butylicus]ABM81240.1 putative ABC transporter [Hyperthermus butylicus DSM 5456]
MPEWLRRGLLRFGESVLSLVIGLLVGAIVVYVSGYDPVEAYRSLFEMSFLDIYGLSTSLSAAAPIMLTGITFAVGVRAGLFNIGAEGQLYIGALGAVLVAWIARNWVPALDSPLGTVAAYALGVILAVGLALIAALLKVKRGVHEVVSTIMLNWIAFWVVEYFRVYIVYNPEDPSKTVSVPEQARLPLLMAHSELSLAIIVSIAFTLLTYFLLWHTVEGYELRAAGLNPLAARYAGIKPEKAVILSFLIGGIAAGLAGAGEVLGKPPNYSITTGLSNLYGLGFDGITVALIGANHPIGIIFAAFFVGGLKAGARYMQIFAGIPLEMVRIVEGVIIIALAIPGVFHMLSEYLRRRKELRELQARGE